ncbi:MAG: hypothetical protein HZB41_02140 [Ignavibacteriae bacterium]|nr:hypothetical protein [Ignavibacteriota bacterium]
MIKIFKPKCYIKILFEVIDYLKQPNYEPPLNLSISNKIQDTIILFIISLIITLFFTLLIVIIFNPTKSFNKEFEILYSPLLQLIIGSVILPILEETTFRLSLIFKPIFLEYLISIVKFLKIYGKIILDLFFILVF